MKKDANQLCFVCNRTLTLDKFSINMKVLLPVCGLCKGSEKKKRKKPNYWIALPTGFFVVASEKLFRISQKRLNRK
jgi:hypothetical protein